MKKLLIFILIIGFQSQAGGLPGYPETCEGCGSDYQCRWAMGCDGPIPETETFFTSILYQGEPLSQKEALSPLKSTDSCFQGSKKEAEAELRKYFQEQDRLKIQADYRLTSTLLIDPIAWEEIRYECKRALGSPDDSQCARLGAVIEQNLFEIQSCR